MPNKKKIGGLVPRLKPYMFGTIRGLITFIVLYLGLAFVMYKTNAEISVLYFLMFLFIVLGGFVCAIYIYKKVGGRGFLTGLIASIPYSIIVFLVFCIINSFNVSSNIIFVFLLTLSGGFLGGITAANTKI